MLRNVWERPSALEATPDPAWARNARLCLSNAASCATHFLLWLHGDDDPHDAHAACGGGPGGGEPRATACLKVTAIVNNVTDAHFYLIGGFAA